MGLGGAALGDDAGGFLVGGHLGGVYGHGLVAGFVGLDLRGGRGPIRRERDGSDGCGSGFGDLGLAGRQPGGGGDSAGLVHTGDDGVEVVGVRGKCVTGADEVGRQLVGAAGEAGQGGAEAVARLALPAVF